jgi:glyoxylase-like metal-dependent hydrolase (beta-lactamase superfamily II)/rhodanese-related sulfurtransferase
MDIQQFVNEGLGNSSYVVEIAPGQAVVIDPDRTVRRYLQSAAAHDLNITAVLETHVHADFITGAVELASVTGATIYNPAHSGVRYPHHPVSGGDGLTLGAATMDVLATPGHTPEHLAYVLRANGAEPLLFSGGSLIVGGAARTDLLGPDLFEQLTRSQYHTLREAFTSLPDSTLLYPTHGGGSFCSAGAGAQRSSTVGEQRIMNPALGAMTEEEWLEWFPLGFPGIPKYYAHMRDMNQAGPRLRDDVAMPAPLSPRDFQLAAERALVVDTRPPAEYLEAHIPASLSNPYRDVFGVWMGWLVDLGTPLLFVANNPDVSQVVDECLLVGHEAFAGCLDGGLSAWKQTGLPLASATAVSAEDADGLARSGAFVLDVREPDEHWGGHIDGATHIPLGDLSSRVDEIPRDRPVLAYCGAGQRSASAVSILERAGVSQLFNLRGGYSEWERIHRRATPVSH